MRSTLAIVLAAFAPPFAASAGAPPARAAANPATALEPALSLYPAREANETAREAEVLSARLGVDLAPRSRDEGPRAEPADRQAFQALKSDIAGYLAVVLEDPGAAVAPPPEELASFLADRQEMLESLRALLIRSRPPRWERNLHALDRAPLPNLLGHIDLNKLLIVDALAHAASGRETTALADLEASWNLTGALREDPIPITQLIAIAVTRLQAGVLRRLSSAPPDWAGRLSDLDFREKMMTALRLEGLMLTQMTERFPPRDLPMPAAAPWYSDLVRSLRGVALFVSRPYIRTCLENGNELWQRHLARLEKIPSLCEADLPALDEAVREAIPWWNRLSPALLLDTSDVMSRIARLDLDLELTVKVLELREARRRNGGAWPSSPRGIGESAVCPSARWLYETGPGGEMSLSLDRDLRWPRHIGIMLPTRFEAVASTSPSRS